MSTEHDAERLRILQKIEDGEINAAEGIRLLNALGDESARASAPRAPARPKPAPDMPFQGWKRWWLWPFGVGLLIAGFSSALMVWAYRAADFRIGGWFILWTLPFLFGLFVMIVSFLSRKARWLHLRVNTGDEAWPRRIAISFPLPIGLAALFLRLFGGFIPPLRRTKVDEVILALDESATIDSPLYVEVNEGDGSEKVQVYIG